MAGRANCLSNLRQIRMLLQASGDDDGSTYVLHSNGSASWHSRSVIQADLDHLDTEGWTGADYADDEWAHLDQAR